MAVTTLAARVTCRGTMPNNEVWANVWHVDSGAALPEELTNAEGQTIADLFETFYDDINALLTDQWSLETIEITPLDENSGGPFAYEYNLAGTSVDEPMINQAALVVGLRTPINDRSHRGRIYLGGFVETVTITDNNRLTSANRNTVGNAAADLNTNLGLLAGDHGSWGIVVYSRLLDVITTVTSFRVGSIFDTQRRRRNRINENYVTYS